MRCDGQLTGQLCKPDDKVSYTGLVLVCDQSSRLQGSTFSCYDLYNVVNTQTDTLLTWYTISSASCAETKQLNFTPKMIETKHCVKWVCELRTRRTDVREKEQQRSVAYVLATRHQSPPEMITYWTREHASWRVDTSSTSTLQHVTLILPQTSDFSNHVLATPHATSDTWCMMRGWRWRWRWRWWWWWWWWRWRWRWRWRDDEMTMTMTMTMMMMIVILLCLHCRRIHSAVLSVSTSASVSSDFMALYKCYYYYYYYYYCACSIVFLSFYLSSYSIFPPKFTKYKHLQ